MTTLAPTHINIRLNDVLKAQGKRKNSPSLFIEETRNCIAVAEKRISPLIVYEFVRVSAMEDRRIRLVSENGSRECTLDPGPHQDLFRPAEMAMVSIHTIGSRLDESVHSLNKNKDLLSGYLLDCAGLVALSETGKQAHTIAETKAAALGWGVSPSLSPGSLEGWELGDQEPLFSMLDTENSGIGLTESGILTPFKSVSTFIGLGPGYASKKVGSVCHICRLRKTCWRRQ